MAQPGPCTASWQAGHCARVSPASGSALSSKLPPYPGTDWSPLPPHLQFMLPYNTGFVYPCCSAGPLRVIPFTHLSLYGKTMLLIISSEIVVKDVFGKQPFTCYQWAETHTICDWPTGVLSAWGLFFSSQTQLEGTLQLPKFLVFPNKSCSQLLTGKHAQPYCFYFSTLDECVRHKAQTSLLANWPYHQCNLPEFSSESPDSIVVTVTVP